MCTHVCVNLCKDLWEVCVVASFPGLLRLQFLIAYSMQKKRREKAQCSSKKVFTEWGIAWLVAMLAQRKLPRGQSRHLGLPFFAYTRMCHEKVAPHSELYPILCLLLAGGVSSSDAVVLERFAL